MQTCPIFYEDANAVFREPRALFIGQESWSQSVHSATCCARCGDSGVSRRRRSPWRPASSGITSVC